MAKDKNSGLNHHEELRYFYLLRNLAYLSDNEKMEYRYLKSKMEADPKPRKDQRTSDPYHQSYSGQNFDNHFVEEYPQDNDYQESYGDLPLYPSSQPLSRRSKRKKRRIEPEQTAFVNNSSEIFEEDSPTLPEKKPRKKRKRSVKKVLKFLGFLLLLVFMGIVFMFVKGMFDASGNNKNYQPAVKEKFNGTDTTDGTNILVLGSDKRVTQNATDARTDTIMVVNVGNKDKKIKMVSFMRDTLVNIPGYSYDNYNYDLKLNSSFNLGEQENGQGAELVRKTLKHNFDIDIKYYMMVDFETFASAIDSLFPNGVKIDAKFATISGQAVDSVEVPDDLRMKDGVVPNQTIKVGEQQMNGRTLLNYARFRKDDDGDYGRTVRQQQVMAEIMSQIKNPSKLFTGSAAIGKVYALTSTNVSFPFIAQNGFSILTGGKGVDHVTIPENGDWVDEYDRYGGQALHIDFDKYQKSLKKMGLR
ncbi:LCP family protein [Streptococcus catagoni]|uniref:LCP family protein n=1 Tax=Streptococcus catagoni TaxID=2654874 RepID=UPI0014097B1D|nr:LCP family protein [Streptococcus catagoni]